MLLSSAGEQLALSSDPADYHRGACRVTHGPNDSYFPNIDGKSVASVRRPWSTLFLPERCWLTSAVRRSVLITGSSRATGWNSWSARGRKGSFTKFGTILADPAWPYHSPRAIVGKPVEET